MKTTCFELIIQIFKSCQPTDSSSENAFVLLPQPKRCTSWELLYCAHVSRALGEQRSCMELCCRTTHFSIQALTNLQGWMQGEE